MVNYNFQYCQKIVVFSEDLKSILLCKRKGENDYDGVYSFIGGKMENHEESFIEGLIREKNEEVGKDFRIEIYPLFTTNAIFRKKSSESMVLPHYYAKYLGGEIKLSDEYTDYKWVKIDKLDSFEPKIPTISGVVNELLKLSKIISPSDFIEI